jgi:hypothetical protein
MEILNILYKLSRKDGKSVALAPFLHSIPKIKNILL